jgi:double-stranded uracil-DNA glycosylase
MILPDYLQPGLKVVFCGTAAGITSAERGYFYARPGNQFWPILHRAGLTTRLLRPEDCHRVFEFGIGLTDLVKHHSGNDSTLTRDMFDVPGFEDKIRTHAPRFVAFTSKEAAAAYFGLRSTGKITYGLHERTIGTTRLMILPSTSGQARKYWDEQPWHDLAALVRA